MPPHTKQTAIVVGVATVLLVVVGLITTNLRSSNKPKPITLTIWGVTDMPKAFNDNAGGYTALHPNVTLKYQKMDAARYHADVLNALAAGQGPDILMIDNHGLPRDKDKLAPFPMRL